MRGVTVLELLTITLMLFLAALQSRAGLFSGLVHLGNTVLAGFMAFNFWEPLARSLGATSPRCDQYADAIWLTALFVLFHILLRLLTSYLAPRRVALPPRVQQIGGAVVGSITGYVLAGVIICVLQTLPLPERFLGHDAEAGSALGAPERVWLGIVHRASGVVFDEPGDDERWFDADGSFAARYTRYRRIRAGSTAPLVNHGEFPSTLGTHPPDEPH
jgi:colicin V production protein